MRLQPWEEFDEPVDRIVSIGAFEHFGFGKYDDYFKKTYNLMPDDGVMLLHTIVIPSDEEVSERKLPLTMSTVRFIKFILDEIYPGGRLPLVAQVEEHATKAGFNVTASQHAAAALRPHPGHLGGKSRVQQGRGHRDHLRRGLRAVHEVPDRLRRSVPQWLHRCLPVHLREGLIQPRRTQREVKHKGVRSV